MSDLAIIIIYALGIILWCVYSFYFEKDNDLPSCSISFLWPMLLIIALAGLVFMSPYIILTTIKNIKDRSKRKINE